MGEFSTEGAPQQVLVMEQEGMEGVRPGTIGYVCVSRDVSLSSLVLPHASSSSRNGRDGADVVKASSILIFPDRSAPGSGRIEYGS